MKTITFIRHAKSDWGNPGLADYERPLNHRGEKDAPEMGRRLSETDYKPQLIYLSTAERTRQTVKLLAKKAKWKDVDAVEKDWLYLASTEEYIKYIEKLHDELDHVCFCGHNPTITSVINYFTGGHIDNVPTCGIGVIEFKVDQWKTISKDSGRLVHYDYPKNI